MENEMNLKSDKESVLPGSISLLKNSYLYFLSLVFILREPGGFRLVVMHNEKHLKSDKVYKTAKGARIAFINEWWYKAALNDMKPNWTHFYPVDPKWLSEKLGEKDGRQRNKNRSRKAVQTCA